MENLTNNTVVDSHHSDSYKNRSYQIDSEKNLQRVRHGFPQTSDRSKVEMFEDFIPVVHRTCRKLRRP